MNESKSRDEAIIALYFARDPDAIHLTRKSFGAYLQAIAFRLLSNREDAEECVSDGCFDAWNSIPPNRPVNLAAYLSKLVRNRAIKRLEASRAARRGGGELPLILDELHELASPDRADERLDAEALADSINRWLAAQKKADRAAFVGRYYAGLPLSGLAKKLGMSVSRVKSLLSRQRAALRAHLIKEGFLYE